MESFEKENLNTKEKEWLSTQRQVEDIKDSLGKGIDETIKQSVVSIKVNGFGTTGSCEGHLDRALPFPWVDVESSLAENNLSNPRYQELKEKARKDFKGEKTMSEEEKEEYGNMVKAQIEANLAEHERFMDLLDDFYKSSNEEVSRLTIKKGPWNQSRLQPVDVTEERAEEIQETLSHITTEEKERKLELYRSEMNRFAAFLKNEFLNDETEQEL